MKSPSKNLTTFKEHKSVKLKGKPELLLNIPLVKDQMNFNQFDSGDNDQISSSEILLNKSKSMKNIKTTYNQYEQILKQTMTRYRTNLQLYPNEIEENKKILNKDSQMLSIPEKKYIDKINLLNKTLKSGYFSSKKEESLMKISIPTSNIEYINPYQSWGLIKSNSMIYDKVTNSIINRQKKKYDDSIKNFESFNMKYRVQMPKIRVTAMMPKIPDNIQVVNKVKEFKPNTFLNVETKKSNANKYYAYYRYPNKNFPECREQFSMVLNGNKIIIVGGMCSVMKTTFIWRLNPITLEWTKINSKNLTNNRFGHSTVCHQNKWFVFGGRTMYSNTNSSVLIGFDVFNLETETWVNPMLVAKHSPRIRRNHIAEVIGSHMLIHGGIGDNNEIFNDCSLWALSSPSVNINGKSTSNQGNPFSGMKWLKCHVGVNQKGPSCYGHASTLVVPRDIRNNYKFTIYKYPEVLFGNSKRKLEHPTNKPKQNGVYIFGGKYKEDGGLSNDLWILLIGRKPFEWTKLDKVSGTKPCPRYWCSMNYYEEGNYWIVHGGRNDEKSESFALNDTYLLNLLTFDWINVELASQWRDFKVISRCGHCASIFGNKLIIFGGMNNNNYIGSTLLIINWVEDYNPNIKSAEEIILQKLKSDRAKKGKTDERTEEETKEEEERLKRLIKMNQTINNNQLGIMVDVNLPPIK